MSNQESLDQLKKIFLRNVRLINNAHDKTIDILRTQKMLNVKLIQRASRCVKDPNPLSSTMTSFSQKYPISLDHELARANKVPNEFFPVRDKDTHKHGRILCKLVDR